jgi:hypothetical protein
MLNKIKDFIKVQTATDHNLWVDVYSEDGDTRDLSPKLYFVFGLDWFFSRELPFMFYSEDKEYRNTFNVFLYLGKMSFVLTLRLGKLPYKNYTEYRELRKKEGKK